MIQLAMSFVAIVKSGGFSQAAQLGQLSKAQLSRHIQQLESLLGVTLMHRTTRSLTLTEAGERFYNACSQLDEDFQQAVDLITHHKVRGTLRITAPVSFGTEYLPSLISQFHQAHPEIKSMLFLNSEKLNLKDKQLDLAFRIAHQLEDSDLKVKKLLTMDLVFCASPNYIAHKGEPQTIDSLVQHQFVTSIHRDRGDSKMQWKLFDRAEEVIFKPNSLIEVDSPRAQSLFVKQGLGIGRIPKLFIKDLLAAGELLEILPNIKQLPLNLFILYPNQKYLPQKVRVFIDFVSEAITADKYHMY